jgi:hypothetical protein
MQVVVSTVTWSPASTILWNALCYLLKVSNEAEIREEWSDKKQTRLLNYVQRHPLCWPCGYYVWMTVACETTPYYRRCLIPLCISYGGMASQWPLMTAVVGGVLYVRSTATQWQEPQTGTSTPAVAPRIHVQSLHSAEWRLSTIRDNTTSLLVLDKNSNIMKSELSRSLSFLKWNTPTFLLILHARDRASW